MLGVGCSGFRFRIPCLGSRSRVPCPCFGFHVPNFVFRVWISCSGSRVSNFVIRVSRFEFRVLCSWLCVPRFVVRASSFLHRGTNWVSLRGFGLLTQVPGFAPGYRDTSLIRNSAPLGPYSRTWPYGGSIVAAFSHERGIPLQGRTMRGTPVVPPEWVPAVFKRSHHVRKQDLR